MVTLDFAVHQFPTECSWVCNCGAHRSTGTQLDVGSVFELQQQTIVGTFQKNPSQMRYYLLLGCMGQFVPTMCFTGVAGIQIACG